MTERPGPRPVGARTRRHAVAAIVLGFLAACGSGTSVTEPPSSSGTVAPQSSPSPATSPAQSATSSPDASVAADAWVVAGSFASGRGPAIVRDVAATDAGLIAVGVAYDGVIPNLGPSPAHAGRVWRSQDGRSWEDVTPAEVFASIDLRHVIERPDGSLLASGSVTPPGDQVAPESGFWTSSDAGTTWAKFDLGFADGAQVRQLERGARGHLASVTPSAGGPTELWYSADGTTWQPTGQTFGAGPLDIGAGDEGFTVVGQALDGSQITRASADGIDWIQAMTPPEAPAFVVPVGGDWIAMGGLNQGGLPAGRTWFSADGLDWSEHGGVEFGQFDAGGATCYEVPEALSAAGEWLAISTIMTYPCSEGGFVVRGVAFASVDGVDWSPLPFEPGTLGETHTGASVLDAVRVDDGIVLVGEDDGAATFWFGEGF